MEFRLLGVAAAAALLAACGAGGEVALSPMAREAPDSPRAEGLCASLVYAVTCVAPRGWDLAEEGPGPGLIMRYASRADTPQERSHLILRAYPAGKRRLSWIVDENIVKVLRASGVSDLGVKPGNLGSRRGLAVMARRETGTWRFVHKLFAFEREGTVFVAEHVLPSSRSKSEGRVLEDFLESLAFK